MSERNSATLRRCGLHLRWTRIATLAAVLLLHLGFLAFLLAPSPGWRWPAQETQTAAPNALLVRLLPTPPKPAEPLRPMLPRPPQAARDAPSARRPSPVALPAHPTTQAAAPTPQRTPRAIDSLIVAAPPDFVVGGGRFASAGYGRQNVRVPGRAAPVRGMPVFRMADPRMQGLAGVVRLVGRIAGAVDPHCLELERVGGMTPQQRIAQHVDADDAQMAAIAARYGCSEPLKPGAAMYNFYHPLQAVGPH